MLMLFDQQKFEEVIRDVVQKVVREELERSKEQPVKKYYNIKELTVFFGVSSGTIHRWKKNGDLKFFKNGDVILFEVDEVSRFAHAHSKKFQPLTTLLK
jgi:hypothetical protein